MIHGKVGINCSGLHFVITCILQGNLGLGQDCSFSSSVGVIVCGWNCNPNLTTSVEGAATALALQKFGIQSLEVVL